MKNSKYEMLSNDTIKHYGRKLYRIKALKSFSNVKAGDLGGYIEKLDNLSEGGNAWVYGDALVFGDAEVYEDAKVYGDAVVFGDAKVYGDTWVSGNAIVCGNTEAYGGAMVYENSKNLKDNNRSRNKDQISPTGSIRKNSGKPCMSHIEPSFLLEMAKVMTVSAEKYEKYNYAGQYYSTAYDSMMRHIHAFMDGESIDKDGTECSHLAHIAINAMIMYVSEKYYVKDYPELDDRFKTLKGLNND